MGSDLHWMLQEGRDRTYPALREAVHKAIHLLEQGQTQEALELLKKADDAADFTKNW